MLAMNTKPLISILTPTWNRSAYLERVWNGLFEQTYQNFEWIVANDGSEDNTISVVKELAEKSSFPVTLINADRRIGKSRMDNELVKCARGEFILWCDSDDVLFPNALEELIGAWHALPESERDNFMGITALCDTAEEGILGKDIPNSSCNDLTLNQVLRSLNSDLVIFTKSELLKKTPFLEVDFLISESSVWNIIGTKMTRFIPVVLERKKYREPHCLSFSGLMEYNRGKAYAAAVTWKYDQARLSWAKKAFRRINFLRYGFHGDIGLVQAFKLWSENSGRIFGLIPCLLPAYALAMKDVMQGKVRKSHLEFLAANKVVKIDVQVLRA